jgi:hemolysin activation/secretion protein
MNAELVFREDFTQNWFNVKLFYDAGMAFNSPKFVDIEYISDHSDLFLQSAGIGFGWDDDDEFDWGFNFAKPLGHDGPIESTIRINLNF